MDSPPPIPQIETPARESALAPLSEPLFRNLWIAAVISYTGTWMQNTGAAWLMTSLTPSPFMISLVQAAMSLPVFLVVLPAGALADVVDRRKLLLITQLWMVVAAAALGLLTIFGMVTPWLLLALTFILGLGAVMNDPAWQAITPEVVSSRNFASGVALNSAGYNIARAVGPALGGLIIAAAGSGIAFLLNALSFFGVIFFLYRWRRPQIALPVQRISAALRDGFTHLRGSFTVRSVLVRTAVFSFFASAFLALLPLVARPFGAIGFGILLACFGLGAMLGAGVLPRLRHAHSPDAVIVVGTLLFALASFALGLGLVFWVLCVLCLIAGIGWLQIIACLNVSAQTMSPAWVRARAISMYILVLQGGMAAGSATWGAVASSSGLEVAFICAACGLVLGLAAIPRYRLAGINIPATPATEGRLNG